MAFALSALATPAAPLPNIVVFLADDMGIGDTSAYQDLTGNTDAEQIATPNLERLADQGVRFTDAHAPAAVCTPTRIALLAGRYSFRSPLKHNVGFTGQDQEGSFLLGQRTIADMLRRAGYRNYGIGKWHLGLHADATSGAIHQGPLQHAFDHYTGTPGNFGGYDRMMQDDQFMRFDASWNLVTQNDPAAQPWSPNDDPAIMERIQQVNVDALQGYLANHQAQYADRPFFIYYATHANHTPWITGSTLEGVAIEGHTQDGSNIVVQVTTNGLNEVIPDDPRYNNLSLPNHWTPYYQTNALGEQIDNGPAARARMVDENDIAVGELLDYLEATDDPRNPGQKLADNTLFIFTSDNGSDINAQIHVGALAQESDSVITDIRGKKATKFEGGTRVPFLAAWPDHLSTNTTSDALFGLNDLYATLADVAGQPLAATEAVDSESVLAAWTNGTGGEVRSTRLVYKTKDRLAIRDGDFKLITEDPTYAGSTDRFDPELDWAAMEPIDFYDLAGDLGETTDLVNNAATTAQVAMVTSNLQLFIDQGYSRAGATHSPDGITFLGGDLHDTNNWHSYTAADNQRFPDADHPGYIFVDGTATNAVTGFDITQQGGTIDLLTAGTIIFDATTWRVESGTLIRTNHFARMDDATLEISGGSVDVSGQPVRFVEGAGLVRLTGGSLTAEDVRFALGTPTAGAKIVELGEGSGVLTLTAANPLRFADDGDPENDYVNFTAASLGQLIAPVDASYYETLWDNDQLRIDGQVGGTTFAASGFLVIINGDGTTTLTLDASLAGGPLSALNGNVLVFRSSGAATGTNAWTLSENGFVGTFLSVTGAPGSTHSVTVTVEAAGTDVGGIFPRMDLHVGGLMTHWSVVTASPPRNDWQFGDTAGTQLNGAVNSGLEGLSFVGGSAGWETDGNGLLVNQSSNNYFRTANCNDITNGMAVIRMEVAGWHFPTNSPENGENISFGFRDNTAGANLALGRLVRTDSSNVNLRVFSDSGAPLVDTFPAQDFTNGLDLVMAYDLDLDTYALYYRAGGDPFALGLQGTNVTPQNVELVRLQCQGTFSDTGEFMNVDRLVQTATLAEGLTDDVGAPAVFQHTFDLPVGLHALRVELNNAATNGNRTLTVGQVSISTNSNALLVNDASDTNCLTAADTYIEHFRKGAVTLTVEDEGGSPLTNAQVQVRLTRHAFNFGAAAAGTSTGSTGQGLNWYDGTGSEDVNYRNFLRDNFTMVSMVNAGKWRYHENVQDVQTLAYVDQILDFAQTNNMRTRLHTVAWANDTSHPPWELALLTNALAGDMTAKTDLRAEISERIDYLARDRGHLIDELDGINEDEHLPDYRTLYGDAGWAGIYQETLAELTATNPTARLMPNEFQVTRDRNENGSHLLSYANWYRRHIEALIEAGGGAPVVNGIGVQGHVKTNPTARNNSPYSVRRTFQTMLNLAVLDLPISITEFDVEDDDGSGGPISHAEAAVIMDTAMRVYFGSPGLATFTVWDFWEPHMSAAGSALVELDFTVTDVGTAYTNNLAEWVTETNLVTDASGRVQFDGFHGDYELIISPAGGSATTLAFELPGGTLATQATVVVCTDCDGDGINDAWELTFVASLTNLAAGTDFDLDGIDDDHEYILDFNPTVSNAAFTIVINDGAFPAEAILQFSSTNSRVYTTEFLPAFDLTNNWQTLQAAQPGSNGIHTVRDPLTATTSNFYRVGVSVP